MSKQHRLDVDYGLELLAYLKATAEARGVSTSVVAKEIARDARLRDALFAQFITEAALAVGRAIPPDEQYDPTDNPRLEAATRQLAALFGSLPAAQGIASALTVLWAEWVLEAQR